MTARDDNFKKVGDIFTNIKPINSLSDYLQFVDIISADWETEELWFRGVAKASHKLIPGIYRKSGNWEYSAIAARTVADTFVLRAKSFFSQVKQDYSEWEWYHLMQHYGMPTRLLDWTEGSLIGLFFAVKDLSDIKQPSVWIVDPFWLNEKSVGISNIFYSDIGRQSSGDQVTNLYLRDSEEMPKYPIAIIPPYIDERLRVQKSCFTIHGSLENGIHELAKTNPENRLVRLEISESAAPKIKNSLINIGITDSTLFPDLEGLAREVRYEYNFDR